MSAAATAARSFNGLYKWELIYPHGPWRGLNDVEFETMSYIDWYNHRRLHGAITEDASYTTQAEAEDLYYRHTTPAVEAVTHRPSSHATPGRFTASFVDKVVMTAYSLRGGGPTYAPPALDILNRLGCP